ncbi:MAG: glutamate synthase subunit beta [Lentisphaerae bacterium]|nr:MAG: glutamate synthase subunit beta [Lentisphaerota bacterium]
MADPQGFLKYQRRAPGYRPVEERIRDWQEVLKPLDEEEINRQAARCMDCGIPFCHGAGCPLHNRIPEFNDLVYQGRWKEALENLHSTNNFPEFTGRVCPAPCEAACTLNIDKNPVTIEHIEYQIAEMGWRNGWITPQPAPRKTGKKVAIVGSGPAGLAAAQQLARKGHEVVVFEKDDRIGGLLRYGIPSFKLDKRVIDRRLAQMKAEGVIFEPSIHVGIDVSARYLLRSFDAICLSMGAGQPRDLQVEGRNAKGVYFALEYLVQQNRIVEGDKIPEDQRIDAKGKNVVVIGGGDTGSDCVGTANRQGAKAIYQYEIMPQPPVGDNPETPWPNWPRILRTSSSHEEGCERRWCIFTKKLTADEHGNLKALHACEIEWYKDENGQFKFREVPGSEFEQPVDLIFLAMGFLHVVHEGIVNDFGLELDSRGNIAKKNRYQTSVPSVFSCGDAVNGASLVVRAINDGRLCAQNIHDYLMNC